MSRSLWGLTCPVTERDVQSFLNILLVFTIAENPQVDLRASSTKGIFSWLDQAELVELTVSPVRFLRRVP